MSIDLLTLEALAADTPASVIFISGMTKHVLLTALSEIDQLWKWSGAADDLTPVERDRAQAYIDNATHEVLTPTGRNDNDLMAIHARYTDIAASTTVADGAEAVVNFTTRDNDTHNAVTVGATWRFRAPAAGWYHITVRLSIQAPTFDADPAASLIGYVNGTLKSYLGRLRWPLVANVSTMILGSDTYLLQEGDLLDVRFNNGLGSTATLVGTTTSGIAIDQVG